VKCNTCNSEVLSHNAFCQACGTQQNPMPNIQNGAGNLELNIKPTFIATFNALQFIKIILFCGAALVLMVLLAEDRAQRRYYMGHADIVGNSALYIWEALKAHGYSSSLLAQHGAVLFFILGIINVYLTKKSYANSSYEIYSDHIEYKNNFWGREVKSVKYCNITSIDIQCSVLQNLFGLGTIKIKMLNGRLNIKNIKNPIKIFDMLKRKTLEFKK